MTLGYGQGHDSHMGHGQQFYEYYSNPTNCQYNESGYVCSDLDLGDVTLSHGVTHPQVTNNMWLKYY